MAEDLVCEDGHVNDYVSSITNPDHLYCIHERNGILCCAQVKPASTPNWPPPLFEESYG